MLNPQMSLRDLCARLFIPKEYYRSLLLGRLLAGGNLVFEKELLP